MLDSFHNVEYLQPMLVFLVRDSSMIELMDVRLNTKLMCVWVNGDYYNL